MAVRYHVLIECKNGEVFVTGQFNTSKDTSSILKEEISSIYKMCQYFNWSQSLKKAYNLGEPLQLFIRLFERHVKITTYRKYSY